MKIEEYTDRARIQSTVHAATEYTLTKRGIKMRTCLLLAGVLALVSAARAACDSCVDRQCYMKHLLHEHTSEERPAIYLKENFLYTRIKNSFGADIRRYNLDTGVYREVEEKYSSWKLTADQNNGDIYIKTFGEIYKINKSMKYLGTVINYIIYHIFFKDRLYAAPLKGLCTLDNGVLHEVPGTEGRDIKEMIVDKNDDIFFREYVGSFQIKRLNKGSTNVTTFSTDDFELATDKDGNAIFLNTVTQAIYRIDDKTGELVEFGVLPEQSPWIVFDKNNNIVYYNSGRLYHLKREEPSTQC